MAFSESFIFFLGVVNQLATGEITAIFFVVLVRFGKPVGDWRNNSPSVLQKPPWPDGPWRLRDGGYCSRLLGTLGAVNVRQSSLNMDMAGEPQYEDDGKFT